MPSKPITRTQLAYLTALTLFSLSVPLLADDPHWPLRIRGSTDLPTEYDNGNLIVSFQPGAGPADNGLQPGEASWLDRGFRPTEPHQLQQTISEDEATQLVTYLSNPDHYVTFYTAPGGEGYFGVDSSEPYVQGQQTPTEPRRFIWHSSVNAGRAGSGGEGGPIVIDGGGTAVIGGGPRVFEHGHSVLKSAHPGSVAAEHHNAVAEHHLENEPHHLETKVHEVGGKQHLALHETGGKQHGALEKTQIKEHLVRSRGQQVSLVKPVNRPLVRPAAAKANNHPVHNNPPKKKK